MKQNRILMIVMVVSSLCAHAVELKAADRPNVVLVLCDDLGYGDLGITGHPYVQSPHIDELARSGPAQHAFSIV